MDTQQKIAKFKRPHMFNNNMFVSLTYHQKLKVIEVATELGVSLSYLIRTAIFDHYFPFLRRTKKIKQYEE